MTLHFAIQFFLSLSLTYSHLVMKTKIIFSIVAFTERKKIYNEVPPLLIYECSFKKKKKIMKNLILCFREELFLQNNKKMYIYFFYQQSL